MYTHRKFALRKRNRERSLSCFDDWSSEECVQSRLQWRRRRRRRRRQQQQQQNTCQTLVNRHWPRDQVASKRFRRLDLRTCVNNTVLQQSLASNGVTLKIRPPEDLSLIENCRLEETRSLLFQHILPVHSLNTKETNGTSNFCYLVPLKPKYTPQHPILQHPKPTSLPHCERQSITATQNKIKIIVCIS